MNAVTPQSPSLRFMDTDFTVNWLAPRWSEIWPIKLCHKYIPYIVNVIGHKIEMERLQGNHIIPYSMQGCSTAIYWEGHNLLTYRNLPRDENECNMLVSTDSLSVSLLLFRCVYLLILSLSS